MRIVRSSVFTLPSVLLILTGVNPAIPTIDAGARGVIWLAVDTEGPDSRARVRAPLEWLASIDDQGDGATIRVEDVTLDCVRLWEDYRDLAVGETREIDRGTRPDGEHYVLRVHSRSPNEERAEGKVHVLARDPAGKMTDVRFPLNLTGLLRNLGEMIGSWFGAKAELSQDDRHKIERIPDLARLAGYGPFTLLELQEADGSRVKVAIE